MLTSSTEGGGGVVDDNNIAAKNIVMTRLCWVGRMSAMGWKADIALLRWFDIVWAMVGKRVRRRLGDIVRIDLGQGGHSYGQVADEPLLVFFDAVFTEAPPPEQAVKLPVLFRIWVNNDAVQKGVWAVVGNRPLATENAVEPYFYKQDAISGALSVYHSSYVDTGWERPASEAECEGLECAAVWEAEHVEDRLRDHFAGRPNAWLESLRIEKKAIPL